MAFPEKYVEVALAFVLFVFGLSILYHARFDTILSGVLAVLLVWSLMIRGDADLVLYALNTFALIAFFGLQAVLLVGPWAHFNSWVERNILPHRRHLGVMVFMFATGHVGLVVAQLFEGDILSALTTSFTVFGFIAYDILLVMAVTSWDWIQTNVKRWVWYAIHGALLFITAGWVTAYWAVMRSEGDAISAGQWTIFVLFGVLWMIVAPWGVAKTLVKYLWGWKHVHMLVYVVYLSIITHAWLGVFQYRDAWQQVAFWLCFAAVLGSHAYGWLRYFRMPKKAVPAVLNLSSLTAEAPEETSYRFMLPLVSRETVAEGTMAFHLASSGSGFTFKPGQQADFRIVNPKYTDDEGDVRTFSIACAPNGEIMFTTRMRNTAFKNTLKELPLQT